MKRIALLVTALIVLGATALLAAPRALTIFINDTPFAGKALWYKDRVYVSLEDLAGTMNATYSYRPSTGEVRLTTSGRGTSMAPASGSATASATADVHPFVKVAWEQKYMYPNNAKIVAQFKNVGDAPARNVEVVCVFKDLMLKPITADVRYLGDIAPDEVKTADFYLYPSGGYAPGAPIANNGYAGFGVIDDDKISVNGTLTPIKHEFRFSYPNAPDTEGRQ